MSSQNNATSSAASERLTGRVKWFNNKAGYGFVTVTDGSRSGSDIFVHHSAIGVSSQQYKYLVQGEYVEFVISTTQGGQHEFQAVNVSGIKGGKLIDLKTGETRYRTKKDYFTYFSNVEYTKEKSEYFKEFINSVMCNNKENLQYFQKMLGYSLTGDISARVFFIWWGVGANGKSIILNLMKEILKDQCQAVAKSVFINNGGKNSNGPETMQLKDCRLATFSETSAKECLNESLIKMISGNDSITCRALYKDPITFTPICKLILCTNHKPDFNGNDKANIDRVRFIPFNARFVDEPKKENEFKKILGVDKIIIEKYLNEFFSFCIDGAKEYYTNQKFEPPQEIKQAQTKYTQDQATISNFINDNYEINEKEKIRKSDVKIHYETYCKDNDLKIEKVSLVYDALIEMTGEPKKINGIYYFKGVAIKQIIKEEEPNDLDD